MYTNETKNGAEAEAEVLKVGTDLNNFENGDKEEDPNKKEDRPNFSLGLNTFKNTYWWKGTTKNGKLIEFQISNFIIKHKYLLKHNRYPKRIIDILNEHDDGATIAIPVKSLVNQNEFATIVEGKGNYIIDWNKKQFTAIKRGLYEKALEADEIEILGHQTDTNYYVFANGVFDGKDFYPIDEYGVVIVDEEAYYIPALSRINEDAGAEFLHEQRFRHIESSTNFEIWNQLMLNVYGNNGMMGIAFVIAAIFRDIIFRHTNFFPLLFLFGKPQSGKSTLRASLQHLFGEPQQDISLEGASSPKGFSRKLAQFRNGLISFEEYKNHISNKLIGMMKNIYDGIGYERAQMTNDNKTHSTPVHSAVVVAGQEMPTKENALFTRVILLEFMESQFGNIEDFKQLKELQEEGLGNVSLEILSQRHLMASKFKDTYYEIFKGIKYDKDLEGMADRNIKNMAVILTPVKILSKVLPFAFSYDDLFAQCKAKLKEQYEIMARTNEVNQFFEIFDIIKNDRKTRIKHLYKISGGHLFIRFNEIYALYRSYAISSDYQVLGKESLLRYLKQHSSFLPANKTDMHTKRFPVGDNATKPIKCYGFKMEFIDVFESGVEGIDMKRYAKELLKKFKPQKLYSKRDIDKVAKALDHPEITDNELVSFVIDRRYFVEENRNGKLIYFLGNKQESEK